MPEQDTPSLTPQAKSLLDALRRAGKWVKRTEIARLAQKSALNKWDLILLAKLIETNLVESRQVPHHGPIGYEWQYRATGLETSEQEL